MSVEDAFPAFKFLTGRHIAAGKVRVFTQADGGSKVPYLASCG
jgi:hypothetical protein